LEGIAMETNEPCQKLVEDGYICKKLYEKEICKIVHLLKEPTEPNENLSQVIEDKVIKDGKIGGRIFKVVARRSYCIQNGFPTWCELEGKEGEFVDALRKSAVVNIIPIPGGTNTPNKKLKQLATEWKHRWYDEKLKQLKPRVVICGGTFWVVVKTLDRASLVKTIQTGMQYLVDPELGTVFLDCWHPSFRRKHAVEYCYFCASCEYLRSIWESVI
jgi:hypothetical protein